MQRLRLLDFRASRGPAAVGLCATDIPGCASIVNTAQARLVAAKETGDEGWFGSTAEMVFQVDRTHPYITTPLGVARISAINSCRQVLPVNNQFFEYLQFGVGRQPNRRTPHWGIEGVFTRNNAVMFRDLTTPPQIVRIVMSDSRDAGKRVLLQGLDNNDSTIYSDATIGQVNGIFLGLQSPFIDCPIQVNLITGLQKDVTFGIVSFYQVDPTSGNQILLHTMQPGETTAWYRRYFIHHLPPNCCGISRTSPIVQVLALCQLELLPVNVDTDYLFFIGSTGLEALILECQSVRFSEMDSPSASVKSKEKHGDAIRILKGQQTHYLGKDDPAVNFKPFGSADLERIRIGMM